MKAFILGLVFTICFAGYTVAAVPQKGETITVKVNREKRESHSKITVRFVEMLEDSRCPTDVQCIQAGNAKIKVRVSRNGRSRMMELNTGRPNEPSIFEGYELKLTALTPEPRSNIRINRNGYLATIAIHKAY